MTDQEYEAVILDLDGVITDTAALHARAWKRMLDDFLQRRGEREGRSYAPFDVDTDYPQYVDGKPREDGIRSFLQARGIDLPLGERDDPVGEETIWGLGNRKNVIFHELLEAERIEVFADAVECIHRWKQDGLKIALVTSSKNGKRILQTTQLEHLFDVRVDGTDAQQLGLRGKPAPDYFLEAARQLGVQPQHAAVVEDAVAGVEAARQGRFATVVGIARQRDPAGLYEAGADIVVHDLRQAELGTHHPAQRDECTVTPCWALRHPEWLATSLRDHRLALFLDYDGTLTPIVRRPSEATLSEPMRALLQQLATRSTLAIISGRDRSDVQQMVQLEGIIYAGSHGFDVSGPQDLRMQQEAAQDALPALDGAEQQLRDALQDIDGAWVERKRFAIAVHYREASEGDVPQIARLVDKVHRQHGNLRQLRGKKIFELQPNVPWNKGQAVLWLLENLGLPDAKVVTIYIGDDTTDEDAFSVLQERGLGWGILVGLPYTSTKADYFLQDCSEVEQFLRLIHELLAREQTADD